jgi:hypothetical protein
MNSDLPGTRRFRASLWERANAEDFLTWRTASGLASQLMRTLGDAVHLTLEQHGRWFPEHRPFGPRLPDVLRKCDDLAFNDRAEALAYAALHLLDRYGRVTQILEHLMLAGRLPLRRSEIRLLEVGAGPAPALYATRDFYQSLRDWPARQGISVAPLGTAHTLDRGVAWDSVLHHVSENLIGLRGTSLQDGALPFSRSIDDFQGFSVQDRHLRGLANLAASIAYDLDRADDFVSDAAAREMAAQQGVDEPSAYDLIVLCNFLTLPTMTEKFKVELRGLGRSLTPGGLLIVLGGIGGAYPSIYAELRTIARDAGLRDLSPHAAFQANAEPERLSTVAEHARKCVALGLAGCSSHERTAVLSDLPKDLIDADAEFKLPTFQVLVFVKHDPSSREARRRACIAPGSRRTQTQRK